MNWVDTAALGVVVLSAMLAFTRGLVRELLGIGAWVGAFFIAGATVGLLRPQMRLWISNPDIADPAAYVAVFLSGVVVLSILTGMVGSAVRTSVLGGLDRSLGVVFGAARGVVIIAVAYVACGWLVSTDRWPEPVQEARSLPYAYETAIWMSRFLPPEYRPNIPLPPPGRETHSADLLQLPAGPRRP